MEQENKLIAVVILCGFASHTLIKTGNITFAYITLGICLAILLGDHLGRKFDKL